METGEKKHEENVLNICVNSSLVSERPVNCIRYFISIFSYNSNILIKSIVFLSQISIKVIDNKYINN